MGRIFQEQTGTTTNVYICKCFCPLTTKSSLISKDFRSQSGQAYLFDSNWKNMHLGIPEDRSLLTGVHSCADLFCNVCLSYVGWIYVSLLT